MADEDDAPPAIPLREPSELAQRIASGHAHDEHFPDLDVDELAMMVQETIDLGESRPRGWRRMYWSSDLGMIVIVNPRDPDGGTAFPSDESYFRVWGVPFQ